MTAQPRERAVACRHCRAETWNPSAVCSRCVDKVVDKIQASCERIKELDFALNRGMTAIRYMHPETAALLVVALDEMLTGRLGHNWHWTSDARTVFELWKPSACTCLGVAHT